MKPVFKKALERGLNLWDTAAVYGEGTGRGEAYNPHLKELTALIDELKLIGTCFDASPAQVATAWAIAKGDGLGGSGIWQTYKSRTGWFWNVRKDFSCTIYLCQSTI